MKLGDLPEVTRIGKEIRDAEDRLVSWREAKQIKVNPESPYSITLMNYDEPSDIGKAYRRVKAACVELLEAQLADAKRRLEELGVSYQ